MFYNRDSEIYAEQTANSASNISNGTNPSYEVSDFLAVYPQFGENSQGNPIVPPIVINMYINAATASLNINRYRSNWPIAMSYFVAHYCTLWLRSSASADDGKDAIVDSGYTEGILTGSSVDGVSYSMDITSAADDLEGYAAWKSTSYGIQLATLANNCAKGGMVVR